MISQPILQFPAQCHQNKSKMLPGFERVLTFNDLATISTCGMHGALALCCPNLQSIHHGLQLPKPTYHFGCTFVPTAVRATFWAAPRPSSSINKSRPPACFTELHYTFVFSIVTVKLQLHLTRHVCSGLPPLENSFKMGFTK